MRRLLAVPELRQVRAVLLTSPTDVFYFTGFSGGDSWAVLTPRKTIIITDGRYDVQAREESPHARIVVRRGPIVGSLAEVLHRSGIKSVRVIAEDVSVALMEKLSQQVKGVRWRHIPKKHLLALRQIKSMEEMKRIRHALSVAQKSFLALASKVRPGQTERQVAAELEYLLRTAGAQKSAFDIIIACGKNAAKPHASSSSAKLAAGKPIIIDFGARFDNYCCDLTRTVWLGKIARRFREVYRVCLEAQREAIAGVKPGIQASKIDHLARRTINRAGYGKYFVHGTGHGIGIEVHEEPSVARGSETVLQPGMVITVEPGIYLPGVGGVRIEDDVLVTATGHDVLSDLPKELSDVVW